MNIAERIEMTRETRDHCLERAEYHRNIAAQFEAQAEREEQILLSLARQEAADVRS